MWFCDQADWREVEVVGVVISATKIYGLFHLLDPLKIT